MQSHYSQSHHSSQSSSSHIVVQDQAPLEICELISSEQNTHSGVALKLTDECSVAIKSAIKSGKRILVHVEEDKSATLEIESINGKLTFKCAPQVSGTPVDAICQEGKGIYGTISSITTKLQVQATEKTFAEMREKTQKIADDEQKRKAKEMPKSQKYQPKKTHHHPAAPTAFQSHLRKSTNVSTPPPGMLKRYNNNNNLSPADRTHSPVPPIKRKREEQQYTPPIITPTTRISRVEETRPKPKMLEETQTKRFEETQVKRMEETQSKRLEETQSKRLEETQSKRVHESEMTKHPMKIEMMKPPTETVASEPYMETFKPSCDWSLRFKKIDDFKDAKRYHGIFHTEYTEYKDLFESLSRIAKEFEQLGASMKRAEKGSPDRHRIEETIQSKYLEYQYNEEFIKRRKRHVDLRAKLEILKQRIHEWEQEQELENQDY